MKKGKILLSIVFAGLCLGIGCEKDDDDDSGSGGGGELGGTWTGSAAGRPMTMVINQSGTSLSGSYTLANPAFSEGMSGTASSATAPASATLTAGANRSFQLNFSSANAMGGSYLKSGASVGAVSASK